MNDVDRGLFGGKDPDEMEIRHPFAAPHEDDGFAAPLPIPVGKAAAPPPKAEATTKSTVDPPNSGDQSRPESGDPSGKTTQKAATDGWHLEQAPDSEFRHEHQGNELDEAKKMQENFEKMQESMKSHFGNVIYHEDGRIENNQQVRYDPTGAAINPAFAAKANMTPNMFAINTLQLGAPLPPGMIMGNDGGLLDGADGGVFGTPAAPPMGLKPASALYADNRSAIAPPNRVLVDTQMFMSHTEWNRMSQQKGKGKKKGPGGDPDARVWIGGLPDDITEDRMRAKFGHFGMLVDIDIKYQPIEKGGGPPFAFLQYETFAEAQKVIEEMDQLRVFEEKNRIKVCGCSAAAKAAARQRTLERTAWEAKERALEKGLGQLEGEDGKVIEGDDLLDFKGGKKGDGKGKGKGKAPRKGDGTFCSGADGKKTAADLEAERVAARWKLLWEKEKKQKEEEEAFKRKERRRAMGLPSTTPPRRPRSPRRSRSRGRRDDRRDDRGGRRDYNDRDRRYDDRREDRGERGDRDRRDRGGGERDRGGGDDHRGDRDRRDVNRDDDQHRRDRDREGARGHRDRDHEGGGEQRGGRDRNRDQDGGGGDRERTRDRGDQDDRGHHDDRVVLKENRRGDDDNRGDRGRDRERRRGGEEME
ncbi:unnamed protein product [Amoebophrya sp. A25]|nr:unnamed protein product [Amoebophrya sp. A25]|eukprot:GSA25T00017749001.1